MIRRFFIWRAQKRFRKPRYKIDHRAYRGQFNAGFFSFLHRTKFWAADNDMYYRRRKRRLFVASLLGLCALGFIVWVIYESVGALGIF